MFHQTQLKYFPPGGPINRTWANVSYLARWARRELSRRTPPERPLKLAWGSVLSVSLARTAANSHSYPHTLTNTARPIRKDQWQGKSRFTQARPGNRTINVSGFLGFWDCRFVHCPDCRPESLSRFFTPNPRLNPYTHTIFADTIN